VILWIINNVLVLLEVLITSCILTFVLLCKFLFVFHWSSVSSSFSAGGNLLANKNKLKQGVEGIP